MLSRLKSLLEEKGELTAKLIDRAYDLPCHTVYIDRFGSIRNAYARIGYVPASLKHQDAKRAVVATIVEVREEFAHELEARGHPIVFDKQTDVYTISNAITMSLVVARCHLQRDRYPRWAMGRPVSSNVDFVLVIRMDDANEGILEYFVLPPAKLTGTTLLVADKNPANVNDHRCASFEEAINVVIRHVKSRSRRTSKTNRKK
jgi:hypothetical protein